MADPDTELESHEQPLPRLNTHLLINSTVILRVAIQHGQSSLEIQQQETTAHIRHDRPHLELMN